MKDLGGSALLGQNDSSLYKVLCLVYPDYEWLPWKFEFVPRNFWANVNNQRKFMEWAGKELKIKDMSDWYNVVNKVKNIAFIFPYLKGFNYNWRRYSFNSPQ